MGIKQVPYPRGQLLEEVMNQYGNDVLYLAFSYVKNYEMAEDLAQDVFIRFYEKIDTFRGEASYRTWLYRITVNRCKDYLRSWNYNKTFLNDKIVDFVKGNASSPEQIVVSNDENEELTMHVLSLPVKYREVIYLYYFQEMSLQELSDCLIINISTVKTRLTRAKELLREKYPEGVLLDGE
ncbi:sigma-70 family RNA polymerase sigma factor [Bacillus suaedaesalsae]|uniref:Sigma-70 family RNA polymerase sigma factor n=1 Tax=Bacillus suaedaesalsae TaxID=2810349 RepID=A0ABS2DJZ4_9BACI|nr:sigma-70 family RNA polymerase sigma factor [Bacillus suaedaesalsae]MBM6618768.1 sigma-70 family RNA polymerase sigma factor [Bacillus suaedaesalsae]